jgi:hypothetical protein
MAFDLSARITADASGMVKGASEGEAALLKLEAAEKRLAAAATSLDIAHTKQAEAVGKSAEAQLRATAGLATAEARFASAKATLAGFSKASNDVTASANRQQYAIRNVGQQFGDFGLQVAGGTSIARAFGQQAGQLGFALSEMGGRLGKVGAFLTGPWGIALTVGAAVLAPFVENLFKAGEAAKEVELGSNGLAAAQGALGQIFDLTTGKIKSQNAELAASAELMRVNARLAGINLRTQAAQAQLNADKTFDAAGRQSVTDRLTAAGQGAAAGSLAGRARAGGVGAFLGGAFGAAQGLVSGTERGGTNAKNIGRVVQGIKSGTIKPEDAIAAAERLDFTGTGVDRQSFLEGVRDFASAPALREIAALADKSLREGELASGLRQTGRTKKPPKPKSTASRDEFGRDAADRLASIREQFDTTPPVIANVNKQLRQLDDLIDDLGRRKPPNFKQLIDDANALKPLIENNLTKPFRDYLKAQDEQLAVQRLTSAGRIDEANALRVVQQLQAQMGSLTDQQKDSVLATVQAMRAQQRELDVLREKNAKYLEALGGIKGVVEDATQAFVRGDLGQLLKSPGKLLDAFQTLQGRKLFDSIFGDVFRELEDQVNGTSVVKDASERMADAVKVAADQTRVTGEAVANFKPPVDDATAALGGFTVALNGAASAVTGGGAAGGGSLASLLAGYRGPTGPSAQSGIDPGTGDIVVVGRRGGGSAGGALTSGSLFERALNGIGSKVAGAFTNPENAKRIGASFGQYGGKAIAGAATGAATANIAAPLVKALGLKTSNTGAAIGGALGSFGGPIGSAIGGVLGSVVGGLFKRDKQASSTLNFADGIASAGAATGYGREAKNNANALGGGLADSLNQIAAQLGGGLGTANVSIGYRPGHKAGAYRVDTTGRGKLTGVQAFDTQEEAQNAALRDAILDGAITGLSDAMQRAVRGSSDVNKAVSEALGVKALETRLRGLNGTLAGIFDTEANSAKERLRLAKAYGLDVAAVERDNVETRTKLIEDTLKSRIGGLSSFLDALKFGDLAEGSPVERLAALSRQIATVQADAEAGKDGAADQLANLLAQKVALSRDSFGTAGGQYSGDRAGAQTAAERVIEMERQRVNEAAGVTTAAQAATTAAVNETNDLIAIQNAKIDTLIAAVTSLGGFSGATPNYGSVLRTASSL